MAKTQYLLYVYRDLKFHPTPTFLFRMYDAIVNKGVPVWYLHVYDFDPEYNLR